MNAERIFFLCGLLPDFSISRSISRWILLWKMAFAKRYSQKMVRMAHPLRPIYRMARSTLASDLSHPCTAFVWHILYQPSIIFYASRQIPLTNIQPISQSSTILYRFLIGIRKWQADR